MPGIYPAWAEIGGFCLPAILAALDIHPGSEVSSIHQHEMEMPGRPKGGNVEHVAPQSSAPSP